MAPKRKRNVEAPLGDQVAARRSKRGKRAQEPTDNAAAKNDQQGDVTEAVTEAVPLDKLADMMLDKMVERGLVFQSMDQRRNLGAAVEPVRVAPADQLNDSGALPGTRDLTQELAQESNGGNQLAAGQLAAGQFTDTLLPGTELYAMPLSQCHSYGLALSALVPDKIKSQIWDKKYIEMSQLYQIQSRGEVKQDFAVNISNQGPSTVVKVQPKQLQGSDLSIGQWLTAFHCYIDVYLQKFPSEASGLLAYTNLIRDLERSCGTHAFNFYDRSFRSHRQTQNLPWGQMHTELWNKAALMSLASGGASRNNVRTGSSVGNRKVCFKFNSARGCDRRQCNFSHMCSFCYKGNHSRISCFAFARNQRDRASAPQESVSTKSAITQGQNMSLMSRQVQGQTAPVSTSVATPTSTSRGPTFRKSN